MSYVYQARSREPAIYGVLTNMIIVVVAAVSCDDILQMSVVEGTTMSAVCWDLIPSHVSSQWFDCLERRERVGMGIAVDCSQLRAFFLW